MSEKKPCVVTITGIRPDFIRMSYIFKKLDKYFNHILIHTGQHFDTNLSNVFFTELNIRTPDFLLNTGKESSNHFEQLSYLSKAIPELFKKENITPDLILFLGDSNSAGISYPLKKEGYKIGHIEAGMRSYDKRMLEEINRTVCDHCSDILFVYHEDYVKQLEKENICENVFMVGNTIVEPLNIFRQNLIKIPKLNNMILVDIHRPENFNYENRLKNIILAANNLGKYYKLPVKLLYFKRLTDSIQKWNINLENISIIDLMPYSEYLQTIYNCKFIISDSGTGQEEPALLNVPVLVPRDFTERPQSYDANCSMRLDVNNQIMNYENIHNWLENLENCTIKMDTSWLGNGRTSDLIISHLIDFFRTYIFNKLLDFENRTSYNSKQPFPYTYIDNYLNKECALNIQKEILEIDSCKWDRYQNPFESKWTLRDKYSFPPYLESLFRHFESRDFITQLSSLIGIELLIDSSRNFWGVHKYDKGDKLDIHVDAGIHPLTKLKKKVTVGLYLSKNWEDSFGCQLEIWKGTNAGSENPILETKMDSIVPKFNRLIIFTCNDYAWHGNPEPATFPDTIDAKRIFVTISYLCSENTDLNKKQKALFIARPGESFDSEKDKLRLLRADPDRYKEIYRV
jgi:UDP-N-acetylglucosamine 2-epimerase (non-hydrolysing)